MIDLNEGRGFTDDIDHLAVLTPWKDLRAVHRLQVGRITSYNVCYTKLLRLPAWLR